MFLLILIIPSHDGFGVKIWAESNKSQDTKASSAAEAEA